jgi:hypothetical protein
MQKKTQKNKEKKSYLNVVESEVEKRKKKFINYVN